MSETSEVGIWIDAPHFCGGVFPGKVVTPIIKYMNTWSLNTIIKYCQSKRWYWEYVRR